MPKSQRVVLRSSWLSTLLNFAPVAVGLLAVQIWERSLEGTVLLLVITVAITGFMGYFNYIELTPAGLGIHWFRMTLVPWQWIASVELVSSWGGHELKVHEANLARRLPAPRGILGIGKKDAEQARDLIEEWLLAYRGSPLPAQPTRTAPPYPPFDEVLDPYRPPAEG